MKRIASHLLVVDDDNRIRDLVKRYLTNAGYHVSAADGGESARKLLSQLVFDLIILDVMMPGMDGFELLRTIRLTDKTTPVIMLTARGEADARIEGLKLGADDYLAKPFEPEELALRIAAILRRVVTDENPVEEIEMSGMVFNIPREELKAGNERIKLTDGELQLLKILAKQAGEPVSREALATGSSAVVDRSVDVQITRLRKKIEPDPKDPIHIQTVRGIGYRLMPDA
jgi:Response regulators consisting of a CheY-like receiver domain and a winged-helix DNA-binding domain